MEEKNNDKEEYLKFFNKDEINRLHRCAKNKDKKELIKWGQSYDEFLNERYYEKYQKKYAQWVEKTFKDLDLALAYSLHFSEATKFGKKRLKIFMEDIYQTMKGFYTKEFSREDYEKMLKNDGIDIFKDEEEEK